MIAACASMVGQGVIRGVLDTVDCQTRTYAQGGYLALTQGSGVFQAALTALLSLVGLVAALVGDGCLDALSWLLLALPVGLSLGLGLRR